MASAVDQLVSEAERLAEHPHLSPSEALRSATWKLKGLQAIDATDGVISAADMLLVAGFLSQVGASIPADGEGSSSAAVASLERERDAAKDSAQQLAIEGEKLRNELSLNEKVTILGPCALSLGSDSLGSPDPPPVPSWPPDAFGCDPTRNWSKCGSS